MRVVLGTNVFVSEIFFGGVPGKILQMWRDGSIDLLLTAEILAEYEDIVHRLHARYPSVDPEPIVSLVVRRGTFVQAFPMDGAVCVDRDDDKFIAAALGGAAKVVVSGDRHLLAVTGYRQLCVLTPSEFVERYGSEQGPCTRPRHLGA